MKNDIDKPLKFGIKKTVIYMSIMMIIPIFLFVLIDKGLYILFPYNGEMGYIKKAPGKPDIYYIDRGKNKIFADLQVNKPKGTIRIFTFGGSTTWGLPYGAEGSFSGWLAEIIHSCKPDNNVEVINTGYPSAPIATVRDYAEASISFHPDIFIIYSGNNEFLLENQVLQEAAVNKQFIYWLRRKLKYNSFVFNHLDKLYSNYFKKKQIYKSADSDFTDFWETASDRFYFELNEIRKIAKKNNIKVILCTIPCNLRDYSPICSLWKQGLSASDVNKAEIALKDMRSAISKNQLTNAEKAYARLCSISPGYAQATFEIANFHLKKGNIITAQHAFIRAKEEDKTLVRVKERFNAIIRKVYNTINYNSFILLDVQKIYNKNSPFSIPGNNLFLDGMHPNLKGHFLIASELAKILIENKFIKVTIKNNQKYLFDDYKKKNKRLNNDAILETIGYFINIGRYNRAEELIMNYLEKFDHWLAHFDLAMIYLKKNKLSNAFNELRNTYALLGNNYNQILEITKETYPEFYLQVIKFEKQITNE